MPTFKRYKGRRINSKDPKFKDAIWWVETLEGICVEHGASGRSLVSLLRDLKDRGIIENRLYEWANELRIAGNEAAHDVNVTTSADDARDIVEFTNALLEYLFTFRDKFEAFKRRRDTANVVGDVPLVPNA